MEQNVRKIKNYKNSLTIVVGNTTNFYVMVDDKLTKILDLHILSNSQLITNNVFDYLNLYNKFLTLTKYYPTILNKQNLTLADIFDCYYKNDFISKNLVRKLTSYFLDNIEKLEQNYFFDQIIFFSSFNGKMKNKPNKILINNKTINTYWKKIKNFN